MVKKNILELSLDELLAIGPDLEDLLALLQAGKFELVEIDEEDLPSSPVTDESTVSV